MSPQQRLLMVCLFSMPLLGGSLAGCQSPQEDRPGEDIQAALSDPTAPEGRMGSLENTASTANDGRTLSSYRLAAKVNDIPITCEDIAGFRWHHYQRLYDAGLRNEHLKEELDQATLNRLEMLRIFHIVRKEAEARLSKDAWAEVGQEVDRRLMQLVDQADNEAALKKQLRTQGQSLLDLRSELEAQTLYEILRGDAAKIEPAAITPDKVKDYYQAHREQFVTPRKWRFRRIFLTKAAHPSAEEALTAAEAIAKQFRANPSSSNFETLRQRVNNSTVDEEAGGSEIDGRKGYRCFTGQIDWKEPILTPALLLKGNDISDPILVRGEGGSWQVQLLYLEKYENERLLTFNEAQGVIQDRLRDDLAEKRYRDWLDAILDTEHNYWWVHPGLANILPYPPKKPEDPSAKTGSGSPR